ncbi:hypothetical protein EV360DRAFT_58340, partial [Lentinula raphanica]
LTHWVQTARYLRTGNEPKLTGESVGLFAKEVWTWWVSLQPSWRSVDGQKPVPLQEDVGHDWIKLDKSGRNGWYGLLACVKWWGTGIQHTNLKNRHQLELDWLAMLEDMRSTLNAILKARG